MPNESTPRSFACLICVPFGSDGADHRERRLHARANVRRAANDLQLFFAVEHAADVELFGIGMFRHRAHFADDDAAQRGTGALDAFDFETRHRQRMRQRRHVIAGVDPIAQPVQADLSWRRLADGG